MSPAARARKSRIPVNEIELAGERGGREKTNLISTRRLAFFCFSPSLVRWPAIIDPQITSIRTRQLFVSFQVGRPFGRFDITGV